MCRCCRRRRFCWCVVAAVVFVAVVLNQLRGSIYFHILPRLCVSRTHSHTYVSCVRALRFLIVSFGFGFYQFRLCTFWFGFITRSSSSNDYIQYVYGFGYVRLFKPTYIVYTYWYRCTGVVAQNVCSMLVACGCMSKTLAHLFTFNRAYAHSTVFIIGSVTIYSWTSQERRRSAKYLNAKRKQKKRKYCCWINQAYDIYALTLEYYTISERVQWAPRRILAVDFVVFDFLQVQKHSEHYWGDKRINQN